VKILDNSHYVSILNNVGQLTELHLEKYNQNFITLIFTTPARQEIVLTINDPTLFSFTRSFGDEGTYVVYEFCTKKIFNTDYSILSELNYGVCDKDGKPFLGQKQAIWIHMEGDIILDIICNNYSFTDGVIRK